jgi:plasmid stabilization system protein ParE
MTLPVYFTPGAKEDVRIARDWYAKKRDELGNEFMNDLHAATNRIAGNAAQFAVVYRSVRQCCMKRFPYVISFRINEERVEILAVLHGHRDPSVWKDRSS